MGFVFLLRLSLNLFMNTKSSDFKRNLCDRFELLTILSFHFHFIYFTVSFIKYLQINEHLQTRNLQQNNLQVF